MKVLVTRPAAQAGEWVEGLRRGGIEAEALPLIGIGAPADVAAVHRAWRQLRDYRMVMFVSPNAVEQFFALRPEGVAWPDTVQAASPGPGTARALLAAGVPPQRLVQPSDDAAQFDSEMLWAQRLCHEDWQGAAVLVVRGEGGRNWLAERWREAGARVDFVSAYRRQPPELDARAEALLAQALAQPRGHLWFFSSSEAIDHLERCCAERGLQPPWGAMLALATHPRIAQRARALGIVAPLECRPALAAVQATIRRSIQSSAP
ncbi:uroporphyrinogen-III synthase [Caldimonas thermodepolymerans]|uniref:Uroporphyrinogen-III synthase n=1 Tax=Caldimonas thermodepolymerans TaxID=215580 RepID=A0AA46DGJ0_9BURK|nr:uroporphyrinogen-III synthase [Caldimonas thermodepolymerans]TCP08925.1 uroporphyrinogen-III synthase [Caldimonas thermodepolymerans]UZG47237.1 uroporphyrinogen-III synthase [Caldimonas thermodepolymerans]